MTTNCINMANPIGVTSGGTGADNAATALTNILGSGVVPILNGGTNSTTKADAFKALAPDGSTVGDMLYWNGTNWVKLPAATLFGITGSVLIIPTAGAAPQWIAFP